MPNDALLQAQAPYRTSTASADATTVIDVDTQFSLSVNLWMNFYYYAATNVSGSNTFQFYVADSADNSTFVARRFSTAYSLSTTAANGFVSLPMTGLDRYSKASIIIAGAGSTPTVTWMAIVGFRI